jgi:type I restriction enzyme S subunit
MKHQAVHLEDVLTLSDSGEWGDDPVNGEGTPVLRVSDVKASNHISFSTAPIRFLSAQKRASKTLKNGDIVVVKSSGSATNVVSGRASLVSGVEDNKFGFANFLLRLRVDERRYNPHFLIHLLGSQQVRDYVLSMVSGSTYPNLRVPEYKRILIPNPPLAEQQRIVDLLDEAFAGIATAKADAEKNLQNARALFDSHLQSIFDQRGPGWAEKPLADLCDIKHGFTFKSEFFTAGGDYVLLTPGNFYESGGYRDRGEKQKYYSGPIPQGFILSKGDLLVAMTEQAAGLLGSPIIVPESDKFLHNQRLGLVTKKPGVPWTNEFFFHVFNTNAVRKKIHDGASGVKVRHTSPTKIGQVIVSFPSSLAEQHAIVSALKDLRQETQRLESIYRRKLAALEALKKSLLHQAFSGEL